MDTSDNTHMDTVGFEALLRRVEAACAAPPTPPIPPTAEAEPAAPEPDDDIFSVMPDLPPEEPLPARPAVAAEPSTGAAWLYEPQPKLPPKRPVAALRIAALAVLLLTLWTVAGALMASGVLPLCDLGYTWFNRHIFALF